MNTKNIIYLIYNMKCQNGYEQYPPKSGMCQLKKTKTASKKIKTTSKKSYKNNEDYKNVRDYQNNKKSAQSKCIIF